MSGRSLFVGAFAVATFAGLSGTEAAQPVQPIPGFQCMTLNLTEQQMADPSVDIPVRSAPSPTAPQVGSASAQVAVRMPMKSVNGFSESLFPTGATVWIETKMLRPYRSISDPTARCVPVIMSNGRPGFTYPR